MAAIYARINSDASKETTKRGLRYMNFDVYVGSAAHSRKVVDLRVRKTIDGGFVIMVDDKVIREINP